MKKHVLFLLEFENRVATLNGDLEHAMDFILVFGRFRAVEAGGSEVRTPTPVELGVADLNPALIVGAIANLFYTL
ncbi:hypothetical protein IPH92_00860 [Candidatus Kaiserbacteria bacterium]|nr:MAG: hypothetical protein IPH92_00860 [Candidatus Kaiserbacteria bacterium]